MPAFTISAVNTGTDTLTAVAHGLLTGDRFRVRNVGGALPTGLTGATDVFAVRVDADNLKVATSNANALAGTPVIDITGAGSGTNTVEYGLPYCVPRIAAVGTQIFHDDDNAAWNALVALYDLLTSQAQSVWSGVTLAGNLSVGGQVASDLTLAANKNVTVSGTGSYKHGPRTMILGPGSFQLDFTGGSPNGNATPGAFTGTPLAGSNPYTFANIPLPSGKQINAIRFYIHDNTTGLNIMTGSLVKNDGAGTVTTIGTTSGSAGNSTDQTLTLSALTTTIAAGNSFSVRVSTSAASLVKIYKAEIDYIE